MIAHLDGHGLILVSFGGWKMTPMPVNGRSAGAGIYSTFRQRGFRFASKKCTSLINLINLIPE
jgi:hypothetical protein